MVKCIGAQARSSWAYRLMDRVGTVAGMQHVARQAIADCVLPDDVRAAVQFRDVDRSRYFVLDRWVVNGFGPCIDGLLTG